MCLYTKQICPQRAKKDIVCYKLFLSNDYHDFMKTLYMDYYIKKPTEGCPTTMDDTDIPLSISRFGLTCQVGAGMIHAYKTKTAANNDSFCRFKRHTYKCIIPKGTLYYVGIHNDICAKQMLVVEKVNPNTAG